LHCPAVLIPGLALKKPRSRGTVLRLAAATENRAFIFPDSEAADDKWIREKQSCSPLYFFIAIWH
jgi:hypothetical protein